ncbi:sensor histidine kinase [Planctobacterium marinum]|uniref:Signal transduction histidine kinase internal region domain-containing protein n=1 Tax=Planctobacterium marinum TaxID=1631968 RepID=A0AA48KT44_9ALTE|nr:hypothetical protein MACH26_26650 [Planctobacterium marinum]
MKYLERVKHRMAQDTRYLFWLWQIGFWILVSLVSFFSLTVWYEQFEWHYTLHTIAQAVFGFLLTQVLYVAFKAIWQKRIFIRLLLGFFLVLVAALVWTAGRIQAFLWLTDEINIWADFGGWYFGSVFIFLCWAGMFHGIRYYKLLEAEHKVMLDAEAEARDAQLQRINAQAIARDAQLKMLRYQLNPHFLCNTLNAINALVEAEMTEQAQQMTVKLSKFLRYSLDNNPDTKIALEHELRAINLYLDIEKTRFGDRLSLAFDIEDDALHALVPSLLVQPIIENSMKHAIAKSESGGLIGFKAGIYEDSLKLELYDTGSGTKIAKTKMQSVTGRGVGLRNTGERLKTLYGGLYSFNVSIDPSGGLRTTIVIPFEKAA